MDLDQLNGNLMVSYGCTHGPACGWQLLASFTCLAGDYFTAGSWLTLNGYLNSLPCGCSPSSRLACIVVIKIHIISHVKHTLLYQGLLKGLSNYGTRLKTHKLDLVIFCISWMWFVLIQETMM